MNGPLFSLLCSNALLATTLLMVGISGHQVVRLMEGVISKTKGIDPDMYRAILFPNRKAFEADITGLSAVYFYPRFMKAITSGDFPELDSLRIEHKKISAYLVVLLVALLVLAYWALVCRAP